jgi:hypothetical protein
MLAAGFLPCEALTLDQRKMAVDGRIAFMAVGGKLCDEHRISHVRQRAHR